jgi:hypothetical protein
MVLLIGNDWGNRFFGLTLVWSATTLILYEMTKK